MKRKIIQLLGPSDEQHDWQLVALCNDGTWWRLERVTTKTGRVINDWRRGLPVRQPDADNEEAP